MRNKKWYALLLLWCLVSLIKETREKEKIKAFCPKAERLQNDICSWLCSYFRRDDGVRWQQDWTGNTIGYCWLKNHMNLSFFISNRDVIFSYFSDLHKKFKPSRMRKTWAVKWQCKKVRMHKLLALFMHA